MDVWQEYHEMKGFDTKLDCFDLESDQELSVCINEAANKGYSGLYIAAPLQHRVYHVMDQWSAEAKTTGMVDAVRIHNGILYGFNTEYFGFKKALDHTGIDFKGKKAMTSGYSGSLNTVVAVLKDIGVSEIVVTVKDKKRLTGKITGCTVINEDEAAESKDFALFVNCGSTGMFPDTGSCPVIYDLSGGQFKCVIDLIYHPWDTALVKRARKNGQMVQNGMWTTAFQVLKAHEIWWSEEQCNAQELFYRMKKNAGDNIVLIGMPGSGKSSVGKTLAKTLNLDFIDTDEYIESFYGKISELFDIGEEYFRRIETNILRQLSYGNSMVVSTGGGIVTRKENINLLKNTGKVFFLDRSPELIIQNDELINRPLLAGEDRYEKLMKLYDQRIHLYRETADFIIDNNQGIFQAVQAIKGCL
ncbi:MAG TPA: hypothetical protein DDZ89_13595 [Clostridiales bacterium]|nr:hypothetical protein [Clostridiales bacterium]